MKLKIMLFLIGLFVVVNLCQAQQKTVTHYPNSFTAQALAGLRADMATYVGDGSGDVLVSGTPTNNALAIWIDASSIEGDPNLWWDGTNLQIINGSHRLRFERVTDAFMIEGWAFGVSSSITFSNLADSNLVISPDGTGTVHVDTSRISGVSNPIDSLDAVNLAYFNANAGAAGGVIDTFGTPAATQVAIFHSADSIRGYPGFVMQGAGDVTLFGTNPRFTLVNGMGPETIYSVSGWTHNDGAQVYSGGGSDLLLHSDNPSDLVIDSGSEIVWMGRDNIQLNATQNFGLHIDGGNTQGEVAYITLEGDNQTISGSLWVRTNGELVYSSDAPSDDEDDGKDVALYHTKSQEAGQIPFFKLLVSANRWTMDNNEDFVYTSGNLQLGGENGDGSLTIGDFGTTAAVTIQIPDVSPTTYTLTLPVDDGLADEVLKTDGAGVLDWVAAGTGDVSKVGTPVDNQVGVWTDDGIIEGGPGLTFGGDTLVLSGDGEGGFLRSQFILGETGQPWWASSDADGLLAMGDVFATGGNTNIFVFDDIGLIGLQAPGLGVQINPGPLAVTGAITATTTIAATGVVSGSNLSGTNTGDQTSIAGITGTIAQFNTAITDGNVGTVFSSGTPVDNQLAIWTDANTVEGITNLAWNAPSTTFDISGDLDVKGADIYAGFGQLKLSPLNGQVSIGNNTSTSPQSLKIYDGGADNEAGFLQMFSDDGNDFFYWVRTNGDPVFSSQALSDDDADGVEFVLKSEEFTHTFNINQVLVAMDYGGWKVPSNITITEVAAYVDGNTATFNLEERAEITPNTPGTDVLTADLVADGTQEESTGFSNASIAADNWLVPSLSAVDSGTEQLSITVRYTIDN